MTNKLRPVPPLGFTLAELLISLLIIGEIATFTIPKIITSQANGRKLTTAKETIATLAAAYQQAQLNGMVSLSSTAGVLTQYMNYVVVDTTSNIDLYPTGGGTVACSAIDPCLRLHSGGLLMLRTGAFGTTTGYIDFFLDPDGVVTSNNDSLIIMLYYNGRVDTFGDDYGTTYTPTWFSW